MPSLTVSAIVRALLKDGADILLRQRFLKVETMGIKTQAISWAKIEQVDALILTDPSTVTVYGGLPSQPSTWLQATSTQACP